MRARRQVGRLRRVADRREGRQGRQLATSGPSASTDRTSGRSRRAPTASRRRGSAPTANICRSPRRVPARRRATRCGCWIGRGGEAFQLTEVKGRLQGYEWSPDSKRLALGRRRSRSGRADDGAAAPRTAPSKAPKPIVIDRYKYKQDVQGYLLSGRHTYIYLFDIAHEVARSPDEGQGRRSVAVVVARRHAHRVHEQPARRSRSRAVEPALRRRREERDRSEKALTPVDEPRRARQAGMEPRRQVDRVARRRRQEVRRLRHGASRRSLPPMAPRAPQRVAASEALDRGVSQPRWSDDGRNIYAIVTDDMSAYGVRIPVGAGSAVRSPTSRSCWDSVTARDRARWRSRATTTITSEVYSASVAGGKLKFQPLTHQNDALLRGAAARDDEEVSAKSKDGTEVHGLLTTPPGYVAGTKIPMLLRIHGGPNGQDQHSVRVRAPVVRRQRLRGARGELPRQRRPRREVLAGRSGPTGGTTRSTICRRWSIRSSRWASPIRQQARRRRLELRRHPHRLHDRQRQRASRRRPAAPAPRSRSPSTARISTSSSTTTRSARRGIRRRGRPTRRSRIRSCTPIASRRRRCFSAASATSTCRCRAGSRCTRRCAASTSTRSW